MGEGCLGNVVTAQHKLSRLSFGHWLAKKVLCEVLHLDVMARFTRSDLDKLVRQNDAIAKAWRASSSLSVNMKALAKAAKVDVQTVYNRRREWRRMYKIDIALPHAFYLTLVTVSPVDAMDAEARAALSETLSHPSERSSCWVKRQRASIKGAVPLSVRRSTMRRPANSASFKSKQSKPQSNPCRA
jgi:hypothetical protein